jgi:hypothetical protein
MTKFSLPHHPGPESLACEGHKTVGYYLFLMYVGLGTFYTLHKMPCRMELGR